MDKCHFYKQERYSQKDCLKRKAWFEKNGTSNFFVCSKLNLTEVPSNTWRLDYDATTHISNIM